MKFFSEDTIDQLYDGLGEIAGKRAALSEAYVTRAFVSDEAKEYAHYGYVRRLKTLEASVRNVFSLLPPELEAIPTSDATTDATINIQASVFNVFASIDNLAWILVKERNLTKADGAPLPASWVGLGPDNTHVRGQLSPEFSGYLEGLGEWFEHLEDFRHALAHRIPLYIPPYSVPENRLDTYNALGKQMNEAMAALNFAKVDALEAEQKALVIFQPVMLHSITQKSRPVVFHAQTIANFNTAIEIGEKMMEELNRQ